jgi:RNA polymerase sigma factor (TIGR02999 family)
VDKTNVTRILNDVEDSHRDEKLYPLVYDNLHDIAEKLFARERKGHTLQPTLLVNEAYLNLVDQSNIDWQGRTHFYAMSAQAIRRLLVTHARSKNAQKRGGDYQQIDLDDDIAFSYDDDRILAIDEALEHLAKVHERQARVVEMKFFGGMKMQEIADEIGVSLRTVEVDWTTAKGWLRLFFESDV